MSEYSAQPSALGYLYQARFALWLLVSGPEEREIVLETLDDIVLHETGNARELLQTKHSCKPANLTDASPQLWKTLRVWSTHVRSGSIDPTHTELTLVTTARAAEGSAVSNLRPEPHRNHGAALAALERIAYESENKALQTAFTAFSDLTQGQRKALVEAVTIMDSSPDIADTAAQIQDRIRSAIDREYRQALFERLEGWWMGMVVQQLRSADPKPIAGFAVYDKIRAIAEQFGPVALPIDYLEARPESVDPGGDDRMFVRQLRLIDVGTTRIEKAILDYYRAFEQRSRWAREELLVGDEVEKYELRLVDEWQRFAAALVEDLGREAGEEEFKRAGRAIFFWAEQTADLRIRPQVNEPYVMRGSFHILANKPSPTVWWHPRFAERLKELLTESAIP